jgi:hypothetical protein
VAKQGTASPRCPVLNGPSIAHSQSFPPFRSFSFARLKQLLVDVADRGCPPTDLLQGYLNDGIVNSPFLHSSSKSSGLWHWKQVGWMVNRPIARFLSLPRSVRRSFG